MDDDYEMEYAKHSKDSVIKDEYVLNGSFGPYVDSHLGRRLAGTPPGYVFEKFTYKKAFTSGDSVLATFRQDELGNGFTYVTNGSTRTRAYLVPESDPAFWPANGEAALGRNYMAEGDIMIGHILRITDKRRNDHTQGGFTAGVLSTEPIFNHAPTGNNPYNIAVGIDSSLIEAYSVGKAVNVPANRTRRVAVTNGLSAFPCTSFMPLLHDATGTTIHMRSAPISAITLDSFNATGDAADVEAELTIYALCGMRRIGGFQGNMEASIHYQELFKCQPRSHVILES
jgi:hypothetical protein